jgi:hypothetical protein
VVSRRIHAAAQVDRSDTNGDTILAVVDATTVGENVDVGALGSEFAISL